MDIDRFLEQDLLNENKITPNQFFDLETRPSQERSRHVNFPTFYFQNFKKSWALLFECIPNIFAGMLTNVILMISVFFAGQIPDFNALAAMGLCNVWINLVGIAPIYSTNIGLLALASQAKGEGDTYKVGILYQRALFANLITFTLSAILLLSSPFIFGLIGFNEDILQYARPFIYCNIVVPFFLNFSDTTKVYLMVHGYFHVYSSVMIISSISYAILCYISFFNFELGILGIGISRALTEFLNAFLVISYIKINNVCQESWIPWNKEALKNLKNYYLTVIPSGLGFYVEWIVFEYLTLLSGMYGSFVLATNTVLLSFNATMFMIPHGIANTIVTYISKSIGAGEFKQTRYYLRICDCVYLNYILIIEIFLFFTFDKMMNIFTSVEDLRNNLHSYKLFWQVFIIWDGLPFLYGSNLRGLGLQNLALLYFVRAYYLIGVPLTLILGVFFNLQIYGWMSGFSIAELILYLFVANFIEKLDLHDRYCKIKEDLKSHGEYTLH